MPTKQLTNWEWLSGEPLNGLEHLKARLDFRYEIPDLFCTSVCLSLFFWVVAVNQAILGVISTQSNNENTHGHWDSPPQNRSVIMNTKCLVAANIHLSGKFWENYNGMSKVYNDVSMLRKQVFLQIADSVQWRQHAQKTSVSTDSTPGMCPTGYLWLC